MNARKTLMQFEYLESRRYNGDLDAADTLMDLQRAVDRTKLTQTQRTYLHMFYVLGMTGDQIAEQHGTSRGGVANIIRTAERRIQQTIDKGAA